MVLKRCLLCGQSYERLARAHIFPRGFFNNLETKGCIDTITLSGVKGRRLQNAIYDPEILCDCCEHGIMQPLDDYAIKIIRDRIGAYRISLPSQDLTGLWVFNGTNKRTLRAFIASILWRVSVSKQKELEDVSVGDAYEERLRQDLVRGGEFDYVDMLLIYLTDPMHAAFLIPHRSKIQLPDRSGHMECANGWMINFPNTNIMVSLDKRPHPIKTFLTLDSSLTGRIDGVRVSSSLQSNAHNYELVAFESTRQEKIIARILAAASRTGAHTTPI